MFPFYSPSSLIQWSWKSKTCPISVIPRLVYFKHWVCLAAAEDFEFCAVFQGCVCCWRVFFFYKKSIMKSLWKQDPMDVTVKLPKGDEMEMSEQGYNVDLSEMSYIRSSLCCHREDVMAGGQHLVFIPRQTHPVLAANKKTLVMICVSKMRQHHTNHSLTGTTSEALGEWVLDCHVVFCWVTF